jgi:hypothetical protein
VSALSQDQELTDKLKLLQDSYKEVLDATKHQDDKIGRFLTAVSFLIGGSIALGTRTDLLQAAYQLEAPPAEPVLLPAYLLSLFLLFIVICLLLLVTGLGARLYRPDEQIAARDSHLFFFSIADTYGRPGEWGRLWAGDSMAIGESLAREYEGEIVNIAVRAKRKYERTLYAGAFLQLAIVFLALAATLGFLAEEFPKVPGSGAGQPAVDWTAIAPRLTVIVAVAAFALFLAIDFAGFERYHDSQRWMRLSFLGLCPAYVAIVLWHPGDLHNWWNVFGFFGVGALIQFGIAVTGLVTSWPAWTSPTQRVGAVTVTLVFILGPAAFLAFDQIELGQLIGAGLVVVLLLGMRLFTRPFPPREEAETAETESNPLADEAGNTPSSS